MGFTGVCQLSGARKRTKQTMAKYLLAFSAAIFLQFNAVAQQCQNDSTGLVPITELTMPFNGMAGGLYGNYQNTMPEAHLQQGVILASQILPLDSLGNYDPDGKIGFISMGMSNCNLFFAAFRNSAQTYPMFNEKLTLVNGATGGADIDVMLNPSSNYWITVDQKMAQSELKNNQVQVIWLLQAKHISGIPPGQGIAHIDTMERKFLTAFQYFKQRYPNLKQIFSSGRDYGGYSNPGSGNPEPYAYYTGWSFRKLVERQINGDTSLSYSGSQPKTAWLAWADYIWADGKNTRSDGFNWLCPQDVQPDGVHPSGAGQTKVTNLLMNFFTTDPATSWFRSVENNIPGDANCDGAVNILDIVTVVGYMTGLNPQPFCFTQADVNQDELVDILDIIETINIITRQRKSVHRF